MTRNVSWAADRQPPPRRGLRGRELLRASRPLVVLRTAASVGAAGGGGAAGDPDASLVTQPVGVLGDQQAALFGQGCVAAGQGKIIYTDIFEAFFVEVKVALLKKVPAEWPAEQWFALDCYREAERRFGVDWEYLAAINMVETDTCRSGGSSNVLDTTSTFGPFTVRLMSVTSSGRSSISSTMT